VIGTLSVRNGFGSVCRLAWRASRSYSEITCAPNSSKAAPISRLSSTTIAVVIEP
jgi:hypothetical protein